VIEARRRRLRRASVAHGSADMDSTARPRGAPDGASKQPLDHEEPDRVRATSEAPASRGSTSTLQVTPTGPRLARHRPHDLRLPAAPRPGRGRRHGRAGDRCQGSESALAVDLRTSRVRRRRVSELPRRVGCHRKMPKGGLFYDPVASPLSGDITEADVDRFPWPDASDPARYAGMVEEARGSPSRVAESTSRRSARVSRKSSSRSAASRTATWTSWPTRPSPAGSWNASSSSSSPTGSGSSPNSETRSTLPGERRSRRPGRASLLAHRLSRDRQATARAALRLHPQAKPRQGLPALLWGDPRAHP